MILFVRNVPDWLHRIIRVEAARRGITMSEVAVERLKESHVGDSMAEAGAEDAERRVVILGNG